jgi:Zn-dependent protease
VLWALGQPAAAIGLAGAFLLGVGLRAFAQRVCGGVSPRRPDPRRDLDPIGAVAVLLGGTGWGRGPLVRSPRGGLALVAGPAAVLTASQAAFACFRFAYPAGRADLAVNRPSDVLRGVVAASMAEQLMLSVAVGLLCFGLLALVPVPPLDGYRLLRLLWSGVDAVVPPVVDRVGVLALLLLLAVPVHGSPPLLAVLDAVGTPLVRLWT